MQAMKTSMFMDKLGYAFLNTILLAAIPAAAVTTLLQAF